MTAAVILAIDLGEFKPVACAYPRGGAPSFHTIASTREALLGLIGRAGPAVVVIEACATSGWAHDLCAEKGLPCKVANTAEPPGPRGAPSPAPSAAVQAACMSIRLRASASTSRPRSSPSAPSWMPFSYRG